MWGGSFGIPQSPLKGPCNNFYHLPISSADAPKCDAFDLCIFGGTAFSHTWNPTMHLLQGEMRNDTSSFLEPGG